MAKKEKDITCPEHAKKDAVLSADEIPPVFVAIDNDLAAENLENDFDMTAADLQDLKEQV